MTDPAAPARTAQHIEPDRPMERTPRALTHETRWLLAFGIVVCIAGMLALFAMVIRIPV